MRRFLSIVFTFVLMTFGLSAQTVSTPTISPVAGESPTRVVATITCATAGATLNYTLNGIDPTPLDPSIASGGTLTVWRPQVLKVKAFKAGLVESAVASSTFYITGKVAAGNNHVAALKSDRTVWSWGLNSSGQLGDGTAVTRSTPVQVKINSTTFLTTAIDIAASASATAALLSDGTVLCWGAGANGKLGNGLTTNQTYPVAVQKTGTTTSLNNVVAIAAGDDFHVALCLDGTVWSWGKGGIGTGTGADQTKATPVLLNSTGLAINGITQIAAGGTHLLMLSGATGAVYSTGSSNSNGQLGDNTGVAQTKAISVLKTDLTPLTGIADLAAGQNHSIAIDSLGAVYAWGLNSSYQLGDNTTTQRNTATLITGITGVVEAAGGKSHTIFVKTNGEVWACGANSTGTLGDGTTTQRTVPTKLPSITNGVKVSARNNGTVIGKGDGAVVGFGENIYGNFGNGTMGSQWTFGAVTGLSLVQKISARGSNTVFTKSDLTAWTVGANSSSQLSNGLSADLSTAVQASNGTGFLTGITQVAQGLSHTLFLKNDGTVWAAGSNANSQLGDNTTTTRNKAVQVLTGTTPVGLTGVNAIAAGDVHSVTLKSDGTVWSFGKNTSGELGDGTVVDKKVATPVLASAGVSLTNVTAIAAMTSNTVFLKGDGTVWVTGLANSGQLGNNTTSANATYPVQVLTAVGVPLTGITAIAGGASHGLALRGSDGAVFAWGLNLNNQLGDGSTTQRNMAVQVKSNATTNWSGAAKIFAGGNASGIIDTTGKFWVWGSNTYGGLGDGTTTPRSYPIQVLALTGALQAAMGSGHTVAIKSDATVQSAGYNLKGQLGNGTIGYTTTPVSASAMRIINGEDADGDGILSDQELINGTNPDLADTDRDGVNDATDTLPLDYYNGVAPVLAIVSGNNQSAFGNEILPNPLIVSVKNASNVALVNAPVTFTMTQGGGKIGATISTTTVTTFVALTDSAGKAQFYWKLGASGTQKATAKAGTLASVTLTGKFWADTDLDGMPDTWETSTFGNLTQTATGDFDGDGVSNLDEYRRGTDPKLSTSKTLTIYVNQTGNDANSGKTSTLPLRTIGGAVARMLTGDITEIATGEYRETKISPGTRNLILRPVGNVKVTP